MRTHKLSIIALILILVAGAFPLSASGHGESDAPERQEISVAALQGPTGVGVARYLSESVTVTDRAEVTFEIVPDPSVMVGRLSSGETDIGMLPSNVAAQLYNRGVPIKISAVTLWGVLYVVGTDDAITEWEDLEGKTVESIARGATPDILLRHLLAENGVDPEADVNLNYQFAPAELAQMVAGGQVDLAVLPEPFVTQVMSRRDDLSILLDFQDGWRELYDDAYPQTVVVVRQEAWERSQAAMGEALALIEDGWNAAIDDPQRAGEVVADSSLSLPGPVVTAALPRLNARYVPAADARSALDRYFQVLHDFEPRTVGGEVPGEDIYLR
ncbi:MAG: PhnD/SsuA/transferrin family substrate-binding protein [Alkalispirochaeta sp.]